MRRIDEWVAVATLFVSMLRMPTTLIFSYAGPCDASAAVATSPNEFVVANDENNVLVRLPVRRTEGDPDRST